MAEGCTAERGIRFSASLAIVEERAAGQLLLPLTAGLAWRRSQRGVQSDWDEEASRGQEEKKGSLEGLY